MSIKFNRVRTPEQIKAEAEKLAALIPSLSEYDSEILAQSSISIPLNLQDRELRGIVRRAVIDSRTPLVVKNAMKRWMKSSWSDSFKARMEAAANQ